MDNEPLILVMTERIALQRYSPNTIKAYKQYIQAFFQTMSDYASSKEIQVSVIEGYISIRFSFDFVASYPPHQPRIAG